MFLTGVLALSGTAQGAGNHGGDGTGAVVRVGQANLQVTITPGDTEGAPRVSVHASDHDTGDAVVDAAMYVLLERDGSEKHAGGTRPSGKDASVPATEEAESLDFGGETEVPPPVDLSSFAELTPSQMAGMYSATLPLDGPGRYRFTLAIGKLGTTSYAFPLLVGGSVTYAIPGRAALNRVATVVALFLITFVGIAGMMRYRAQLGLKPGDRLNLLDVPGVRRVLKSGWFQPVFQIPTLVFFLLIIALGLHDIQQGDRNAATILMWTVWWAGIIFTFVLLGRVWCMMCPFGAVQDWLGRRWSRGRTFPKAFRNIWLSTFIFLGLTWWDAYSGIVNNPALTSYLLIGFFAVAVGTALVYRGRAFCRYVCPIGGLIGIYSMFSPLELRNRCLEVCRSDTAKGCIKGTARHYPCPMFITPMTLDRNNYCNFCSECIKTCAEDNIVLRFRSFAKDLWVSARGYLDEAFLAVALLGVTVVVTAEMVEPWHRWMDAVARYVPFSLLGWTEHGQQEKGVFSLIFATSALIIAPGLLLGASALVRVLAGKAHEQSIPKTFVHFAYMFVPVGLSMHLAHNLAHLLNEGPVIVPAIRRVLNRYLGLGSGVIDWQVTALLGPEALFWLQMLVLIVLNGFSLYAGYRIALRFYGSKAHRAFLPMAMLAVGIMVLNAYVLGQPMSARHSH